MMFVERLSKWDVFSNNSKPAKRARLGAGSLNPGADEDDDRALGEGKTRADRRKGRQPRVPRTEILRRHQHSESIL